MRTGLAALAVLALAVAGCGGNHAAPTAPQANLPPVVSGTSPAARSFHVPTDTPIWAAFDRALDPATVDNQHIALMIDTRRLPCTVTYDAANRRIVIVPGSPLALLTTHTVQFQPGLRTADGDSLGATYFWQFTTLGVRTPHAPYPVDGATGESPFVELLWQGTESTSGPIAYDLFAGPDSAVVASRSQTPVRLLTERCLPTTRWPQDGPFYWSVRTTNQNSGDVIDGPIWRFDPLPASTPFDSVMVGLSGWWYGNAANLNTYSYFCLAAKVVAGAGFDNLLQWNLTSLGPGTRLAGALVQLTPTPVYNDGNARGLSIRSLLSSGRPCGSSTKSPFDVPVDDKVLAPAIVLSDHRLQLQSDALAAAVESMARRGTLDGNSLRATSRIELQASSGGAFNPTSPRLILYVYQTPPPPLARRAR